MMQNVLFQEHFNQLLKSGTDILGELKGNALEVP
jgi:hypothetical protein